MQQTICMLVVWWSGFVAQGEGAPPPKPAKDPELRSELLRRTKVDQEARHAITEWINKHGSNGVVATATLSKEKQIEFEKVSTKVLEIDKENTKWLASVVEKHGWPTNTLVGKDGASAAWLLVQHADADPKFQRHCLDRMTKLPKDEVSQSNLAYLTDRVLLAEGKKQLYGTQFATVDGKLKPRPIEDEANVDKRRALAGLSTLAEYTKRIEQVYGGAKK